MNTRLSLFKKSRNIHINKFMVDGRVKTADEHAANPLDKLYERAARNAILNGGGRADKVRCYPGTREEVIRMIEDWKDRKAKFTSRMMWLSGPAGAGKTAIVQTVMEEWKRRGIPAASFFFFRGDSTRNNSKPIVATLMYQLFDHFPALKQSAENLLLAKPLIMEAPIYDQFMEFINAPICVLTQQQSVDLKIPIVLLIDGLDECCSDDKTEQERVLRALRELVARNLHLSSKLQAVRNHLILHGLRADAQSRRQLHVPVRSVGFRVRGAS